MTEVTQDLTRLLVDMTAACERLRADRDALVSAAVAKDRERICAALPGGWSVDPQWVADMVRDGSSGVTT